MNFGIGTIADFLWGLVFVPEIKKAIQRRKRRAEKAKRKAEAAKRKTARQRAKLAAARELLSKIRAEQLRRERAAANRQREWLEYMEQRGIEPLPIDPNPYDDAPPKASDP